LEGLNSTLTTPDQAGAAGCRKALSPSTITVSHSLPKKSSGVLRILGATKPDRIHKLINSVIENTKQTELIMAEDVEWAFGKLNDFMFKDVYLNIDDQEDRGKIPDFIKRLYEHFCKYPEKLPKEGLAIVEQKGIDIAVCDYIAGMTDGFAIEIFEDIFVPKAWE
jgi:dGTPase